jgi:hypothetical protein
MNIDNSLKYYKEILDKNDIPNFRKEQRILQAESVVNCINEHFNFDDLVCIETGASQDFQDGCFGLMLCHAVVQYSGKMFSVDNDETILEKNKELYKNHFGDKHFNFSLNDSVEFLKNFDGYVNLVHLDSWDLNLKNPVPSMLHGFLEFEAIKDKMPSGSIIVIDDNFLKGTWVSWDSFNNGKLIKNETISIDYDIIGKGSLIYHYCQLPNSDWEIIGNHYKSGKNIKLIIKKK